MSVLRKIFGTKYYAKKSFTYFLPAPPERRSGYQEKEFDQIFSYLMKKNYDILDIKMQSLASTTTSGVWILCILGAKTPQAAQEDIAIDYAEIAKNLPSNIQLDPDIIHEC